MDIATLEAGGWKRLPTQRFSAAIGPTWLTGVPGNRTVGLISDDSHGNDHMGTIHGGVLMTFVDIALGVAVVDAIVDPYCATAQLQYQFVAAGQVGSFITCQPELVRRTSSLVFVRGLVKADDKVIGSTDGIFKVLEPTKFNRLKAG